MTTDIGNLNIRSSIFTIYSSLSLVSHIIYVYKIYIKCRWWQTFLVALVVYSAWASPFELAFRSASTGKLMIVDLIVDAFFAVDIILTFFVAYVDKSTYLLVVDHKKIALRFAALFIFFYLFYLFFFPFSVHIWLFSNLDHRQKYIIKNFNSTLFNCLWAFNYLRNIHPIIFISIWRFTLINVIRYLTRLWLPMDIASTLPFQLIYRILTGNVNSGEVFGFLNLLRLWRLRRVAELFKR